ncbi:MAG TPA: hypothetical protein VGC85_02795 [Chthoniobacterales bacterium]
MKTQNTYSLLVTSQEKARNIFEAVVCTLVVLCVAFTAFQFVSRPVVTPGTNRTAVESSNPRTVEVVADASAVQTPVLASNN